MESSLAVLAGKVVADERMLVTIIVNAHPLNGVTALTFVFRLDLAQHGLKAGVVVDGLLSVHEINDNILSMILAV